VAVGVYRRVGYKLERWHDVGWWQRPLRTDDRPPSQIETIAALQARDDWAGVLNRGLSDSGKE
jgi:phosphinothricin acetyltransferase